MQLLYIALNLMDFTLENRTNYKKANSKDVKKIVVMDKNRK